MKIISIVGALPKFIKCAPLSRELLLKVKKFLGSKFTLSGGRSIVIQMMPEIRHLNHIVIFLLMMDGFIGTGVKPGIRTLGSLCSA